jgi:hypothetical protein
MIVGINRKNTSYSISLIIVLSTRGGIIMNVTNMLTIDEVNTEKEDFSSNENNRRRKKKKHKKRNGKNKQRLRQIIVSKKIVRRKQAKKNKEKARRDQLHKLMNSDHSFFDFIDNSEFFTKKKIKKIDNDAAIHIPKVFSLIDNPDESIDVYNQIYNVIYKKGLKGIYFDHSSCDVLEISASTVMDVFVMHLEEYRKIRGRKLSFSGKLPPDEKNKIALYVSGLLKHLKVSNSRIIRKIEEAYKGIQTLELVSGGKHTPTLKVSTSTKSDDTQTKIIDYFKSCLATQGIVLNEDGTQYFLDLVGEAINNCELHSGSFCQWFTLGHYWMQETYGECNIVLFNFGQTIYEGLKNNITSDDMKKSLEQLSNEHSKKGFFGIEKWDEETLWTLYALQDGVSRCRSDEEPDRGTGTVKLIDAFQQIGDTIDGKKAKMSIISGRSCIYFDGEYRLQEEKFGNEVRQIIAFNPENDLYLPPDKRYVTKLKNYFPGTVISMRFYLDKRFFEEKIGDIENGN